MLHGSKEAKDQKLQHAWHLGSDGVKTLAILIFSRTPRQWQRILLCLPCLMNNALEDILSYPNQVSLIPLWVHWFLSTHQHLLRLKGWTCVCMCVCWWGDKKNNNNNLNMPCFQLCSALAVPPTEVSSRDEVWGHFVAVLIPQKIEIYWNLRFNDNFVTTLLVIDRRVGAAAAPRPWSAWPILHLWVRSVNSF